MGPCQGPTRGPTINETIAQERGAYPKEIGYTRIRAPAKPVTRGEFAALRDMGADRRAIERH